MKKILISLTLFSSMLYFTQVGINTANPQGTLHVDGANDNPTIGIPTTAQQSNDIAIISNGNMGIGTINPTSKLEINSATGNALKISDTTQGLGKVLTSDSNGNAKWAPPGTAYAKLGVIPVIEQTVNTIEDGTIAGDQRIAYSGSYITLQPGKYQINFTLWCSPTGTNVANSDTNTGFASVFLSTSSSSSVPPAYLSNIKSIIIPRLYNNASSNPDYYGTGSIPVNINAPTTLYLWVYMANGNWVNAISPRSIRFRYDSGNYGPYVQMYAVPFEVE